MRRQPSAKGLRQIGGNHLDVSQPCGVGVGQPAAQVLGAVALRDVDEHVTTQVDQPGGVDDRVLAGRLQKRRLIDTEVADPADALRVVDERGPVLDDGVHHRPPAHPELLGHLRHRPGELADLAARLSAGASGEHDLGVEMLDAFGPRLAITARFAAPPPPLDPPQPRRSTEARQIADIDRDPVLGFGARTTALAPDHGGRRLDRHDHLDIGLADLEHPEPGQSQQRLGEAVTFVHAGAFLVVAALSSRDDGGALSRVVDPSDYLQWAA